MDDAKTVESARTEAIQDGFRADIEAHQAITATMTKLGNQFSRVEGKLDTIFDLTPVREMRAAIVAKDDAVTPVDRPSASKRTPPRGLPSLGEYVQTKPVKR